MPYKQRFFFILFGAVILLLAIYKKNLKQLFAANEQINRIDKDLAKLDNSYDQIYYLNNEIKELNAIIGGQSERPQLVQQYILDFINKSSYNVNIFGIEDTHVVVDEDFKIYTNRIQIEGDFKTLLQLLFYTEKNFLSSKIISAQFFTKKNYTKNTKKLFLELILQNYEKTN